MVKLSTPIDVSNILPLKLGDQVLISGTIYTGRDRIHRFLIHKRPSKKEIPFDLEGGILYHCGPLVKTSGDSQVVIAAGPTTSSRMDIYQPEAIRNYGLRAIIGKGGMGDETLRTMKECGCVYLNTINGAAVYLADRVKKALGAWKIDEFGEAEALWALEVEDFPALVTMDAHGNSLHKNIRELAGKNLNNLI